MWNFWGRDPVTTKHKFTLTVTLNVQPALIDLARRWLDSKHGMTPAEEAAVTERLTATHDKLQDIAEPPPAEPV